MNVQGDTQERHERLLIYSSDQFMTVRRRDRSQNKLWQYHICPRWYFESLCELWSLSKWSSHILRNHLKDQKNIPRLNRKSHACSSMTILKTEWREPFSSVHMSRSFSNDRIDHRFFQYSTVLICLKMINFFVLRNSVHHFWQEKLSLLSSGYLRSHSYILVVLWQTLKSQLPSIWNIERLRSSLK